MTTFETGVSAEGVEEGSLCVTEFENNSLVSNICFCSEIEANIYIIRVSKNLNKKYF